MFCVLGAGLMHLSPAAYAVTMNTMGVTGLMKRVKALPTRDRERLLRELLTLEDEATTQLSSRRGTKSVRWPDVEARAKRILGNRVLPNLVLLERGEEPS